MPDTLEFDSIELDFDGRKILSSVYMICPVGHVVGLLGRNGSGKSCLMKIVFGSMDAQHKHVRLNGEPLPANYLRRKIISYLPQEDLVPNDISLRAAFEMFEVDLDRVKNVYPEIMSCMLLKPNELSGGIRRLVETLLVLFSPARFCILDEPFSGLMPLHIERMIGIINIARRQKGIILTDHMYRHVSSVAASLYVLSNGQTYAVRNRDELVMRGYLSPG